MAPQPLAQKLQRLLDLGHKGLGLGAHRIHPVGSGGGDSPARGAEQGGVDTGALSGLAGHSNEPRIGTRLRPSASGPDTAFAAPRPLIPEQAAQDGLDRVATVHRRALLRKRL